MYIRRDIIKCALQVVKSLLAIFKYVVEGYLSFLKLFLNHLGGNYWEWYALFFTFFLPFSNGMVAIQQLFSP